MRQQFGNKKPLRLLCAAGAIGLPLTLFGCGGGGSGNLIHAAAAPQSATATAPDGLTETFSENTSVIAVGGSVTYTLTLTNNTSQSITYSSYSGCGIDVGAVGGAVDVRDAAETQLYPPSTTCTAVSAPVNTTLAPGQSASGSITLSGIFTSPGTDTATAAYTDSVAGTSTPVNTGPLTLTVQ